MSHCHRLFAFVLFYFLLSKGNFLRKKKIILIDSFRILEKEKKNISGKQCESKTNFDQRTDM